MKLKAVLFDLDGTLRDTRDAIYDAYQEAIAVHTDQQVSREAIKPHVHHHTVVHKAFAEDTEPEAFHDTYAQAVDPAVEASGLYPGTTQLLRDLQAQGYRIAIVTSAIETKAQKFMKQKGLDGFCDAVIGMAPGRNPKPAPDLIEAALEALDIESDEAVMVGDMEVDVAASHAAGVACLAITHGFNDRDQLHKAGADRIIDSLKDVPAALTALANR